MFDSISPQIWIVLALAITALGPATYVWRHLAHSYTPRDITLPPEDMSWKSQKQLLLSSGILCCLLALGLFVFTPEAEAFAKSDWLAPAVLGAIGSLAIGATIAGWRDGEVEPLIRGPSRSYSLAEQPKRYWASMAWNGLLGVGLVAGSSVVTYDNLTPECDDDGDEMTLSVALEACNAMLAVEGLKKVEKAELLGDRGRVHHRLGNDKQALLDYSRAIEIDPEDSYAFYNRALIRRRMADFEGAVEDFEASLALRPRNDEAYLERGLMYLDTGLFDKAIADFTRLHEYAPDNPYALPNRGVAFAWLDDEERAERDFRSVGKGEPGWPIVLRGRAILALNREDYPAVIRHLTQALEVNPDDYFALRLRADAYWEVGEEDLARDDDDRSMALDMARNR